MKDRISLEPGEVERIYVHARIMELGVAELLRSDPLSFGTAALETAAAALRLAASFRRFADRQKLSTISGKAKTHTSKRGKA